MRPSWNGKPLRVMASASTSTGLVNLRTMARSSRDDRVEGEDLPLGDELVGERRLLDADGRAASGSKDTWVTQLSVIPLRRSPARLPTTYRPDGSVHRHPPPQAVVLVLGFRALDPRRIRPDRSTATRFTHGLEPTGRSLPRRWVGVVGEDDVAVAGPGDAEGTGDRAVLWSRGHRRGPSPCGGGGGGARRGSGRCGCRWGRRGRRRWRDPSLTTRRAGRSPARHRSGPESAGPGAAGR